MEGFFFNQDDVNYGQRIKPKAPKAQIELSCDTCGLMDFVDKPMTRTFGKGKEGIMFVLSFPEDHELRYNMPLAGSTGRMIDSVLQDEDLSLTEDCFSIFAMACPPSGEKVDPLSMDCCRERLFRQINKHKPAVIIPLGYYALAALVNFRSGDTSVGGTVERWRGHAIPDAETGAWICPIEDPLWVMGKQKRNPAIRKYFDDDLVRAVRLRHSELPRWNNSPDQVVLLDRPKDIQEILAKMIADNRLTAFDYETTGRKPYAVGHEIYTIGVCNEPEVAYAWRHTKATEKAWIEFLLSSVAKAAANKKFEEIWSRTILKTPVNAWIWDTMLAEHTLDNRRGVTGLKFQSLVYYGVWDYDSHISEYLKSEQKKNANSFNRIKQAPIEDILRYNGLDCIFERRRALQQMKMMQARGQKLVDAYYEWMHDGSDTFADMEERGVPSDQNHLNVQRRVLLQEVNNIETGLFESKLGKMWRRKFGDKKNVNSNDQVIWVLEREGIELTKKTKKDNTALDKEVLEQISHPLASTVLRIRKLSKAAGTFLTGIQRESVNGLCHPFFNLHNVVTYRSSCIAEDTLIEGTPIQEIKSGDILYSVDDFGQTVAQEVDWAGKTGHRELVRLHYEDEDGNCGFVDVTPEHLIRLNCEGEQYIEAEHAKGQEVIVCKQ